MSEGNIKRALFTIAKDFFTLDSFTLSGGKVLSSLPTMPLVNVSWPNRVQANPAAPIWGGVNLLANVPQGRTVGRGGRDEATGILQIDLDVKQNTGESLHYIWAEKARAFFHPGRSFNYGTQWVTIRGCGIGDGRGVGSHYRKSISISYSATLIRKSTTGTPTGETAAPWLDIYTSPATVWALGGVYSANDIVQNGGANYVCLISHTATGLLEPGTNPLLSEVYWDLLS
tara:strand:- start:16227 stop:16913 length:687 start_codon:yes stop_codon:yes gene_type:complete